MNKLLAIQSELKAPKSQYNSFGKYNYRNCEDILEAVKPLLLKHDCTLTISDEIIEIGGRVYVKAIALLNTSDGNYATTAYAREASDKKGMDDSQITGATSSYARKYALNGLFLIDDNKDADNSDNRDKPKDDKPKEERNVFKMIEACKSEQELVKLWKSLSDVEKEIYKDTFTEYRNKINEA